jgi:hypothetical protein
MGGTDLMGKNKDRNRIGICCKRMMVAKCHMVAKRITREFMATVTKHKFHFDPTGLLERDHMKPPGISATSPETDGHPPAPKYSYSCSKISDSGQVFSIDHFVIQAIRGKNMLQKTINLLGIQCVLNVILLSEQHTFSLSTLRDIKTLPQLTLTH